MKVLLYAFLQGRDLLDLKWLQWTMRKTANCKLQNLPAYSSIKVTRPGGTQWYPAIEKWTVSWSQVTRNRLWGEALGSVPLRWRCAQVGRRKAPSAGQSWRVSVFAPGEQSSRDPSWFIHVFISIRQLQTAIFKGSNMHTGLTASENGVLMKWMHYQLQVLDL